ncbi:MAG: NAD(P)-dependent oxidoreductase [bacterium]|nr:NAD(P)-dependent oxidoreductase [bacterium]
MNVYITGISGLLGGYLWRFLTDDEFSVTGTDLRNPDKIPDVELTDITECTLYQGYFDHSDINVVIHSAGRPAIFWAERNPHEAFRIHALGTLNVLEGVRKAKRKPKFVYISSAEVYRLPNMDAEKAPTDPTNFYGLSKLAGEEYVRVYGERFGFPYTILRPSAVYGPGAKKGVPYDLTHPFVAGEEAVKIYTSPDSVIDYVYIADVANAVRMALGANWDGVTANIGSNDPLRVHEAYEWICDYTGVEIPLELTAEASNVVERTVTNGAALKLGWKPEYGWRDGFGELLK